MPINWIEVKPDLELVKLGIHCAEPKFDYNELSKYLINCVKVGNSEDYIRTCRIMCQQDLFFLVYFVLDLPVNHPFLMQRCYDAQDRDNFTIDLWARGFFKSTILTLAKTIFDLIQNREERVAVFSHTKTMAQSHVRRIKEVLSKNQVLQASYPEIFYDNPERDAQSWSDMTGLSVRRKGQYAEASVEAHGLMNLPAGKHFTKLIYDDIIELGTVWTADQIAKAYEYYQNSLNLSARLFTRKIIGTRYSHTDPYSEIMKGKKWKVRIYPGEVDDEGEGILGGRPVYLSREELDDKFDEMEEFVYSAQILQDPTAASKQKFNPHWLRYSEGAKPKMNVYGIVDYATSKTGESFTVMMVIGADALRNYWLLDMVRDHLDLGSRWERLKGLVKSWNLNEVGYEKYGANTDIEYMNERMEAEGVYFNIKPLGAGVNKLDRIRSLIPLFNKQRIILPKSLVYLDIEGNYRDLVEEFIHEEYLHFPYTKTNDMLDCLAYILDMDVVFPTDTDYKKKIVHLNDPLNIRKDSKKRSWMSF